jgi:hypothetical protein
MPVARAHDASKQHDDGDKHQRHVNDAHFAIDAATGDVTLMELLRSEI